MRNFYFLVALIFMAGIAFAQPPQVLPMPNPTSTCPTKVGEYVVGEATAQFIKGCLGAPAHEDRNPDGRFIYYYEIDGGVTIVAFLFDSQNILIKVNAFKHK